MLRCVKKCCEVLKMNDYAVLIPELRSAMNITQKDLAKLLGATSVSVSRWENGKTILTKIIKVKLNKLFDRYNSGTNEAEYYFEELEKLLEDLKEEQNRCVVESLTEEELEIYDLLLVKGKSLTKEEIQRVKLAAKNLYKKLVENRDSLLVVDWYKDENTTLKLKKAVEDSLDEDLPVCYDKERFSSQKLIYYCPYLLIRLFKE